MARKTLTDEEKRKIIKTYKDNPRASVRQISDEVGINKSTVGRVIKEYRETFVELDIPLTVDEPEPKPEPEKKKAKPKKSVIKIPELDEVVLFLQENSEQFPTLPKTFVKRVTGKDRWIIEQLIKIQRAIVS